MLGYVSREEHEKALEAVRGERDRALARAERAEGEAKGLRASVETLRESLKVAVDRLAQGSPPPAGAPRAITSEEIMRQPAIGRRGLAERDRLRREAEQREAIESTRRNRASALAPEEEAELAAELEVA